MDRQAMSHIKSTFRFAWWLVKCVAVFVVSGVAWSLFLSAEHFLSKDTVASLACHSVAWRFLFDAAKDAAAFLRRRIAWVGRKIKEMENE